MLKNLIVVFFISILLPILVNSEEINLNEISISANLSPTRLGEVGSSVSILTADDISKTSVSHIIDYIDAVSGVSINQNGPKGSTSGVNVRGLGLQYIKVLVDGINIGDVSSIPVMANLSGLRLNNIERIEILKGSQSALYGSSAIGGVISITTNKSGAEGGYFSGEIGAYSSMSISSGRTFSADKSDFDVNGEIFKTDGFSAKAGGSEPDGFLSRRISISGNYYLSDMKTFSLSASSQHENGDQDGFDNQTFEFIDKADEVFSNDTVGLASTYEIDFGDVLRRLKVNYFGTERFYTGPYEYLGESLEFSYQEDRRFGDNVLILGLSNEKSQTMIETVEKEIDQSHFYGEYLYNDVDNLSFSISGRTSGHSQFGGSSTGRVSAVIKLLDGFTLKSAFGTGYRAPSLFELFAPFYGNNNLRPERSITREFGFDIPISDESLELSGTVFETDILDKIIYDYSTFAYGQSSEIQKRQGFEINIMYEVKEGNSVTLSFTRTQDENGNRVQKVPENDLSVLANVALPSGVNLSGSLQRVVGLEDFVILPDYSIVSARVSYPLTNDTEVYLRGENLFDTVYETASGYGTSGRAFYAGFSSKF